MQSVKELREMEESKLAETLAETRQELFTLRFRHATAQLENTQQLPNLKKTIARILTVQRERAMGA
ncbi:50S ribosomal protein L29 [Paucidesulfovibrio longus]|jgi:large subunit ribosomal protein L29|uniref:50S ribosomal protein L29 n=1 Tax=Paucidesulfovibrio longus TaxID=889 RepID=UPI0003B70F38|nr:50S ribosomal protein L29 [Paucidesulfovibrio longus]